MTMTLVGSVTLGGGGANVLSFTNIPQTGDDLLILFSGRSDSFGDTSVRLQINGSHTTNIVGGPSLYGNGLGTATGGANTSEILFFGTQGSNYVSSGNSNVSIYIANYSKATTKAVSVDSGVATTSSTTPYVEIKSGAYVSTSPITSIGIYKTSFNFTQYSSAYLYVITKA